MKILVVEDDRKVAGFIEQGLREEGYAVDGAKDRDEATTLAHVNDYDAILLDLMLPKKNGLQVAAELRREGRRTPILMLTARDSTEDVVRGLDAGADDYLSKPFKFFQLLEHFMLHPEEVIRRTELLEKVWDMHFDPESNVVDVHVGNLRRKLREAGCDGLIQTGRGVGFCLKSAEAVEA